MVLAMTSVGAVMLFGTIFAVLKYRHKRKVVSHRSHQVNDYSVAYRADGRRDRIREYRNAVKIILYGKNNIRKPKNITTCPDNNIITCPDNNIITCPYNNIIMTCPDNNIIITCPNNNIITCPGNKIITCPGNNIITCPDKNIITCPGNNIITCPGNNIITCPDNNIPSYIM